MYKTLALIFFFSMWTRVQCFVLSSYFYYEMCASSRDICLSNNSVTSFTLVKLWFLSYSYKVQYVIKQPILFIKRLEI